MFFYVKKIVSSLVMNDTMGILIILESVLSL